MVVVWCPQGTPYKSGRGVQNQLLLESMKLQSCTGFSVDFFKSAGTKR